MLMIIADKSLM